MEVGTRVRLDQGQRGHKVEGGLGVEGETRSEGHPLTPCALMLVTAPTTSPSPSAHLPWRCLSPCAIGEIRYWLSPVCWYCADRSGLATGAQDSAMWSTGQFMPSFPIPLHHSTISSLHILMNVL